MRVLVLNTGSSSLKYEVFATTTDEAGAASTGAGSALASVASGLVEGIGEATGAVHLRRPDAEAVHHDRAVADHGAALDEIVAVPSDSGAADGLVAVGHRVVHGGEEFRAPRWSTTTSW